MNLGDLRYSKDHLLLKRLLILRALVIIGSALVYIGGFVVHIDKGALLPYLLVLGATAVYSFGVWFYYNRKPVSFGVLAAQLVWDSLVILIMVWFSGRSTNPFIYYWLVIIAISASIFSPKVVWAFCLGGIATYSSLMYLDFNLHLAHMNTQFRAHLVGMWLNFVGSALLISFFIGRLTGALREKERTLALAREEILKSEQLIGIGTLAASTVHSFGTPLSTIAMAIDEIEALHQDLETTACTQIIQAQINRCKQTMSKLSALAGDNFATEAPTALNTLIADIHEHFSLANSSPIPVITTSESIDKVLVAGGMLLKHALINLIDNAVHAAKTQVKVEFTLIAGCLEVVIQDDGGGIAPDLLPELGGVIASPKDAGMGIGILIANSTIERLNGEVHFSNPDNKNHQPLTRVLVKLPKITTSE